MSFLERLGDAIFTGERSWAWRRRMAFAGCSVFLWGIVYAIRFEPDTARMTAILSFCVPGFGTTFAAYAGLAGLDDHLKRETARKAAVQP
jgi:hypothetical protein